MNALEHQLHYPLADALPAPAQTLTVAPGIRWVRMPLPFALDHINLWLLQDRIDGQDCWTLIDCGIASDATRALWSRLFDEGLDGLPIGRLLCTHNHPDHVGCAGWLAQRFDAPPWMTIGAYIHARVPSSPLPRSDPPPPPSPLPPHRTPPTPTPHAFPAPSAPTNAPTELPPPPATPVCPSPA